MSYSPKSYPQEHEVQAPCDNQALVYVLVGVGVVVITVLVLAIFIGVRMNRRK
ncbi:MAG: hypothetical protein WAX69_11050 [Victivallales bacterium]